MTRTLTRTGWTLVLGTGLLWCFLFVRLTIDDAFITWRYGQTLVDFGQWNWQPDTPRVEAYTNPAYAFLSVVPAVLHLSPELFFKLVSAGLLVALARYLSSADLPSGQRLVVAVALVANPAFWIHLWSGLETPLLVVTLITTFGELYLRGGLGRMGLVGLALLALSRPEGLGFALAAAGWMVVLRRDRRTVLLAGATVACLTGYWVARTALFGAFFPNTFYVKTEHAAHAAGVVRHTLSLGLAVAAAVLAVVLVGELTRRVVKRMTRRSTGQSTGRSTGGLSARAARAQVWTPAVVAVLACGVTVVLYGNSHLTMDYANRFRWQLVVPVVAIALLAPVTARNRVPVSLALAGAAAMVLVSPSIVGGPWEQLLAVVGLASAAWLWSGTRAAAALGVGALACVAAASLITPGTALYFADYSARADLSHGSLGRILAESRAPDRTLTIGDAGKAPMRSGWRTVDLYGLANRRIARTGEIVPTLRSWRPSVVVVTTSLADPHREPAARLARDPLRYAEQHHFRLAGVMQFHPQYYLRVYVAPSVDAQTRRAIAAAAARSRHANHTGDLAFLRSHLFTFPFLQRPAG